MEQEPSAFSMDNTDPSAQATLLAQGVTRVREEVQKVVIGQDDFIELLLAALFCGGHILVEGVPGIAKTLTSKLLAQTLQLEFSRIQFTPDLMPSDVLGTTVYNVKHGEFSFNPGPIFANLVLIDEINRAPAKTQAALFEVMEESQITVDGRTYPMDDIFFVMATQNPIEQEGTYKLPEAQLDRFLLKIVLSYPTLSQEQAMLRRFSEDFRAGTRQKIRPVLSAKEILACRQWVEGVNIQEDLLDYIALLVHRTRNHGDLFLGASPRASLAIMKMAKAIAAIRGRNFVTPDDIQYVVVPVLQHRILLTPEREIEGHSITDVVREIISSVPVPR